MVKQEFGNADTFRSKEKALSFYKRWKKKGFKVYEMSKTGGSYVLVSSKRKPTEKQLEDWNIDGYGKPIEIKSELHYL